MLFLTRRLIVSQLFLCDCCCRLLSSLSSSCCGDISCLVCDGMGRCEYQCVFPWLGCLYQVFRVDWCYVRYVHLRISSASYIWVPCFLRPHIDCHYISKQLNIHWIQPTRYHDLTWHFSAISSHFEAYIVTRSLFVIYVYSWYDCWQFHGLMYSYATL